MFCMRERSQNCSLTAEPFGVRVMDVKVWTKNILYSHFLLQGEAVIFTCRVHHRKINQQAEFKYGYSSSHAHLQAFLDKNFKKLFVTLVRVISISSACFTAKTEGNLLTLYISMLLCSGDCSLIPETATSSLYYTLLLSLRMAPPATIHHCR